MYYLVDVFLNILFSGSYEECETVAEKEYTVGWMFGGVSILLELELKSSYGCLSEDEEYLLHRDDPTYW